MYKNFTMTPNYAGPTRIGEDGTFEVFLVDSKSFYWFTYVITVSGYTFIIINFSKDFPYNDGNNKGSFCLSNI